MTTHELLEVLSHGPDSFARPASNLAAKLCARGILSREALPREGPGRPAYQYALSKWGRERLVYLTEKHCTQEKCGICHGPRSKRKLRGALEARGE